SSSKTTPCSPPYSSSATATCWREVRSRSSRVSAGIAAGTYKGCQSSARRSSVSTSEALCKQVLREHDAENVVDAPLAHEKPALRLRRNLLAYHIRSLGDVDPFGCSDPSTTQRSAPCSTSD